MEQNNDSFITVISPAGATYNVMTEDEKEFYEDVSGRYQVDNYFKNITDLQDLDRVLFMELMTHRWQTWLSQESDYFGESVDLKGLKEGLADYSRELRQLKKSMGMDKLTRDKDKGESVRDYIEKLRVRAKEFGVMREEQSAKSITLFQELKALIVLHDNCTDDERRENKITEQDIVLWIRSVIPEFDRIDEHFRNNSQKTWIREM